MNISATRTNCPAGGSSVIPVDRPVANADTLSLQHRVEGQLADLQQHERHRRPPRTAPRTGLDHTRGSTRRSRTPDLGFTAHLGPDLASSSTNMVTLIPPGPGQAPPMNITTSEPNSVPDSSWPGSRLLKPAVRSMVALKNGQNRSFGSNLPSVPGAPLRQQEHGAGDQQHHGHTDGQPGVQAPLPWP